MPMKLRDGKLYKSHPTSRMLLRDGKVVDAGQSILVDKNGILFDGRNPFDTLDSGNPRGNSPRKNRANETEAGKGVSMPRPIGSMDIQQQRRTRRSERLKEEIMEEFVQKTTEVSVITSKTEMVTKEKTKQHLDFAATEGASTMRSSGSVMTVDSLPRSRLTEGFVTSTPVNDGSFTVQENDTATSLIFSENITSHSAKIDDQIIKQPGFTRIVGRKTNDGDFVTPVNKSSRRRNVSDVHNRSFEDNVFEDLSKPIMYNSLMSEDFSDIESFHDQTDFSLLRKRSFSNQRTNFNPSLDLDHARWSKFHDWRRQWYLNRWNIEGVQVSSGWLHRLITIVVHMLMIIQKTVNSKLAVFITALKSIWFSKTKKATRTRNSVVDYQVKESFIPFNILAAKDSRRQTKGFCCFICLPLILSIMFGLLIASLWPFDIGMYSGASDFNLTEFNMKNAKYISFDGDNGKNPAWHVLPEGHSNKGMVGNTFPVVFYIRNARFQMAEKRIETFQVLSSAAYNVIIPVFPAPKSKLLEGWSWTSKIFNESSIILWGEVGVDSDMQVLAKELCVEGHPPSGVIIESKEIIDYERQVKEYEVWRCNCSTVKNLDGSLFAYTHVRCPLIFQNIQRDIINCLQALKK